MTNKLKFPNVLIQLKNINRDLDIFVSYNN